MTLDRPFAPLPPIPPPPPRPARSWVVLAILSATGLLIGLAAGVGVAVIVDDEPATEARIGSSTVVPDACLDALDAANEISWNTSEFLRLQIEWEDLPAGSDAEAANEAEQQGLIDDLEPIIDRYLEAEADCRGAAA